MSAGESSSRSLQAAGSPSRPGPAVDAFQNAFAGYLANTVSVDQLRRVVANCVLEAGNLARVIRDSLSAALRARCLPRTDYRALVADLPACGGEDAAAENRAGAGPTPGQALAERESARPALRPLGLILRGRVFNSRYEIRSRVAAGGLGMLYKAIDHRALEAGEPHCAVAVKVLNPAFRNSAEALLSLRREARNAARLEHPNIRQVYSFERCGADFFVTMEWLNGESLATRLDRTGSRAMPRAAAFQILAAVAAGLNHAHRRGVVHGDVKPANVFITTDGHVKLLDFGQISALDALAGQPSLPAISPAYASCELHEGQPPEARDDVFSLAVMAYRVLAGARPFGRYTPLDAERAGIEVLRPAGLTATQWWTVQRGLAWRRSQRMPNVDAFMSGLLPKSGLRIAGQALIEAA